jgi:hypothetical protein
VPPGTSAVFSGPLPPTYRTTAMGQEPARGKPLLDSVVSKGDPQACQVAPRVGGEGQPCLCPTPSPLPVATSPRSRITSTACKPQPLAAMAVPYPKEKGVATKAAASSASDPSTVT